MVTQNSDGTYYKIAELFAAEILVFEGTESELREFVEENKL